MATISIKKTQDDEEEEEVENVERMVKLENESEIGGRTDNVAKYTENDSQNAFETVFVKGEMDSDDDLLVENEAGLESFDDDRQNPLELDMKREEFIIKQNGSPTGFPDECDDGDVKLECDVDTKYEIVDGLIHVVKDEEERALTAPAVTAAPATKEIKRRYRLAAVIKGLDLCGVCGSSLTSGGAPCSEDECKNVRAVDGAKVFLCGICTNSEKSYPNFVSLRQHLRLHFADRNFKCPSCDKRFLKNYDLQSHLRTHTGEKPFSCDVCGRNFRKSSNLHQHMRIHSGETPYVCKLCGLTFNHSGTYKRHVEKHKGIKPYACGYCPKSFARGTALKEHTLLHFGKDAMYKCDQCDKSFNRRATLKDHQSVHESETAHECVVCKKTFGYAKTLKVHMRAHNGEDQRFKCELCSRTFTTNENLKQHLRTHTGERPYVCKICFMAFNNASNLRGHTAIHTRESIFACEVAGCAEVFTDQNERASHALCHAAAARNAETITGVEVRDAGIYTEALRRKEEAGFVIAPVIGCDVLVKNETSDK